MTQAQTTVAIHRYLQELAQVSRDANSEPLVAQVLAHSVDRLHLLCSTLLHREYPRLERAPLYVESGEILDSVVMRLLKAMREVRPENPRQFFALANKHMRWELNDLARRIDHQGVAVELHESRVPEQVQSESGWNANAARILQAIESLPEEEREVFELIRIQGLSHTEAAELIGVATKTIQRRLNRGLLLLTEKLGDLKPAEPNPKAP
jgi:RNA polymerase sigma-70 factor (ECF subfamily)